MNIRESIKSKRPTQFGAVEIRFPGGYYYVCKVSPKCAPAKGRSQKTTGESIGKIKEADGFMKAHVLPGTTLLFDGASIFYKH